MNFVCPVCGIAFRSNSSKRKHCGFHCAGLARKDTRPLIDRLRATYSYDQQTGLFTFNVNRQGRSKGDVGGVVRPSTGYVILRLSSKSYMGHRMAWLYVTGELPAGQIDHINGDRSDNRIVNLRDVDKRINAQNLRGASAKKKSGLPLGVVFHKATGKWQAQIELSGQTHYLGLHQNPELAHSAYVRAKRELHEGNTL